MHPCFIKKYTYHRIKKIFLDDYGLTLTAVTAYKGTRYGQPRKYNLVDENGEIELSNVTLDALRMHLTAEGYPLKEETGN